MILCDAAEDVAGVDLSLSTASTKPAVNKLRNVSQGHFEAAAGFTAGFSVEVGGCFRNKVYTRFVVLEKKETTTEQTRGRMRSNCWPVHLPSSSAPSGFLVCSVES